MFRIFRRIRLEFFSDKRSSKYFLYALGEIVLVVIGILIALEINNASEERKNRTRELQIMQSLHSDFVSSAIEIDLMKKSIEDRRRQLFEYIQLLGPDAEVNRDQVEWRVFYAAGINSLHLVDGALKAVLNSNDLNLIKNLDFQAKLSSIQGVYENYKRQEEIYIQTIETGLRDFSLSHFSISKYMKSLADSVQAHPTDFNNWTRSLKHQNDIAAIIATIDYGLLPRLKNLDALIKEVTALTEQSSILSEED